MIYNQAKPIIYIYPQEETNLVVKAKCPELFTCTYPKYDTENGWHVIAQPDGTLFNISRKDSAELEKTQKLYSLYWEGNNPNIDTSMGVGFCVKGEDVAEFLEEKLTKLGLNYKEQEEFIVYWLPKLEKNKYNFIRFALTEECNKYMPLEFTEVLEDGSTREAKIDNLIRILMIYKPLNKEIEVKEQELLTPSREGFTVVEWGGSEI